MNRLRLAVFGVVLAMAVTATGQQAAQSEESQSNAHKGVTTPEAQLKFFTEKFDLTSDQQAKMRPILQNLHDFTAKVMADKSLTQEEKIAKVKPVRRKAHEQMMALLNDDQKKKVEEYLKGPHAEMHGDVH
jgi:Spy/CpxP family protein refolding chaperone